MGNASRGSGTLGLVSSLTPSAFRAEAALAWTALSSGTRWAEVALLPGRGTLYRIQGEPGSRFPPHTHRGGEEVYVLAGDYADDSGTYRGGDYLRYPPGSRHEPWTAGGCDLLVIWWDAPEPAVG